MRLDMGKKENDKSRAFSAKLEMKIGMMQRASLLPSPAWSHEHLAWLLVKTLICLGKI